MKIPVRRRELERIKEKELEAKQEKDRADQLGINC